MNETGRKKMSEMGRVKGLIALFMLMLLIFGAQSYYLYFEYIPMNLAPYVDLPEIHAHVQKTLYVIAGEIRYWFLALEGCITGLTIAYYIKAKKKKKP